MKKIKPEKSEVQVNFSNLNNIREMDSMKAFKKKFSANIIIMSYIRGDESFDNAIPFEPYAHIIEG